MRFKPFRLAALLGLSVAFVLDPVFHAPLTGAGFVWADDDGGDDGGDDDGAAAGRDGAGRAQAPRQRRNIEPAAPRVQPLPEFSPEIVAIGLAAPDLQILLDEGFALIEATVLQGAGTDLHRLAPPPGLSLGAARDRVRALSSGAGADFNHFYRSGQDSLTPASAAPSAGAAADCNHDNCGAHHLVGWPGREQRVAQCPPPVPIGVIDTGVNAAHDLLANAGIEVVSLAPTGPDASGKVHGTAVLSALAGRADGRVAGLLPEAPFVVADIFVREGNDERADVASLLRGLDLMDQRGIRVVNLSLAGPPNAALDLMVRRLVDERQMVLVAAVGNGGADRPVAHPAAIDGVIAVTAVDGRGRLYRSAQRGPEVDLAAPGVGLMLATSISGAREKTGTSFAAPFVSAAAALALGGDPGLTPADVLVRLTADARDLGDLGHDPGFGHGLLQAQRLCP